MTVEWDGRGEARRRGHALDHTQGLIGAPHCPAVAAILLPVLCQVVVVDLGRHGWLREATAGWRQLSLLGAGTKLQQVPP